MGVEPGRRETVKSFALLKVFHWLWCGHCYGVEVCVREGPYTQNQITSTLPFLLLEKPEVQQIVMSSLGNESQHLNQRESQPQCCFKSAPKSLPTKWSRRVRNMKIKIKQHAYMCSSSPMNVTAVAVHGKRDSKREWSIFFKGHFRLL